MRTSMPDDLWRLRHPLPAAARPGTPQLVRPSAAAAPCAVEQLSHEGIKQVRGYLRTGRQIPVQEAGGGGARQGV